MASSNKLEYVDVLCLTAVANVTKFESFALLGIGNANLFCIVPVLGRSEYQCKFNFTYFNETMLLLIMMMMIIIIIIIIIN